MGVAPAQNHVPPSGRYSGWPVSWAQRRAEYVRMVLPFFFAANEILHAGPYRQTFVANAVPDDFDQLNPAEARYYRRAQAMELLEAAGFQDVQLFHRHGYSWTVIGTKPAHA